jgi:hypothetical protein
MFTIPNPVDTSEIATATVPPVSHAVFIVRHDPVKSMSILFAAVALTYNWPFDTLIATYTILVVSGESKCPNR